MILKSAFEMVMGFPYSKEMGNLLLEKFNMDCSLTTNFKKAKF
jgi:hypothetical protein